MQDNHNQITYTIIKETIIEGQLGNRIRAGNCERKVNINSQDRICLVLPKQLIAIERWQGALFGATKWLLYIFRTGNKGCCFNTVPGVFPKVDLLFFCVGAARVKKSLKLLSNLEENGIKFTELNDSYWLHQNARIQTARPLILPFYV